MHVSEWIFSAQDALNFSPGLLRRSFIGLGHDNYAGNRRDDFTEEGEKRPTEGQIEGAGRLQIKIGADS